MRHHEGSWRPFPGGLAGHGGSSIPPSALPASFPLPAPTAQGQCQEEKHLRQLAKPSSQAGTRAAMLRRGSRGGWLPSPQAEVGMPGPQKRVRRFSCLTWGTLKVQCGHALKKWLYKHPLRSRTLKFRQSQGKIGTETAAELQRPRKHVPPWMSYPAQEYHRIRCWACS